MAKTNYTTSDHGLRPRLGALVIMIAGIILVFALISRIDLMIKYLTPSFASGVEKNQNSSSRNRIISAIGAETRYQDKKSLPQSINPGNGESRPASENTGSGRAPKNLAAEEKKAILPSRPGKGCKLSDISKMIALKDCSPAEKSARVRPPDSYQHAVYRIGGPSGNTPRNRGNRLRRYTLKDSDTLWSIAARVYGNGKYYTRIMAANPGLRADRLPVGKRIVLPGVAAN